MPSLERLGDMAADKPFFTFRQVCIAPIRSIQPFQQNQAYSKLMQSNNNTKIKTKVNYSILYLRNYVMIPQVHKAAKQINTRAS